MTVAGCGPDPDAGKFTPSPETSTPEPTFASPSPTPSPSPALTFTPVAPTKKPPAVNRATPRRVIPRATWAPKPAPTKAAAVYYPNCAAVRAAGKAPLYRGQPGYRTGLDRDHDGIACDVKA